MREKLINIHSKEVSVLTIVLYSFSCNRGGGYFARGFHLALWMISKEWQVIPFSWQTTILDLRLVSPQSWRSYSCTPVYWPLSVLINVTNNTWLEGEQSSVIRGIIALCSYNVKCMFDLRLVNPQSWRSYSNAPVLAIMCTIDVTSNTDLRVCSPQSL